MWLKKLFVGKVWVENSELLIFTYSRMGLWNLWNREAHAALKVQAKPT